MVYQIQYNTHQKHLEINDYHNAFSPKIIQSLCELDIKTFAFFEGLNILILTNGGMVYSMPKGFFNENQFIAEGSKPNIINESFDNEIVEDIACGKHQFLVLTSSGKVYYSDSIYNGDSRARINVNKRITFISCGHFFNVIVTEDGKVYSWGNNDHGQLGISNFSKTKEEPSKVKGLDGVIISKVACGYTHVLALSNEGDVYVWGANTYGQLGLCTNGSMHTPKKLDTQNIKEVVDIATSCHHHISFAMDTNNRVFMWGQCLGRNLIVPTLTSVSSIHDAFAFYASPKVMHKPLIFYNNNKNSTLDSLKCLFNDPTTSDLIIQVHGNPIHVHKSILMIRCQYFRTRFQEDCVTKDQSVIEENMFPHNLFKAFLQYLYTDKIDLSPEDTFELLILAHHYSVNQLKIYCVQYICNRITVKNAIVLYNMAIAYNFKKLEDSCFKFILRNMTASVLQTPSFDELDGSGFKNCVIQAAEAGFYFRERKKTETHFPSCKCARPADSLHPNHV
ncbi:RCC1 and BTB domain-containing protein 1 isoform X2 [Lasioglossum baleicum]|uniref:RCC1 and BTB domain-containing protein 1 isoform X2 n=1 Tax=Lasioglossum baleicum TaxID=434251 RepID=UPI003FCD012E